MIMCSQFPIRTLHSFMLFLMLVFSLLLPAQQKSDVISTTQFAEEVTNFLDREIAAHVADIHSLNPPQERVAGALATGDFSWGTFMRALASYSALSGKRTLAGKDLPRLIGQIGLIESKGGGKTFAQMYAAMSLCHFGVDLKTNPVWQSLTPDEQAVWRSLLDPTRFYDTKTRHVINLPENYFGVAARIVTMDYRLGTITDRAFVDDVLNRAAEQFTRGSLYSDDALPAGRFDRYSNEYARYIYEAAESVGRKDLMLALEPTLKTQMRTWWDLLSPDGYGYPWGRSLGVISYIDTIEIVAFLAEHPQFRPAPLPQLASAYYAAWNWLSHDYLPNRHLLNALGFGRGNYSYLTVEREWQQTTAFFGKVAGAHASFIRVTAQEHIDSFPAHLNLPPVERFEYFRKGPRPAGVWLVRHGALRFALPITTGTKPGVSDYLPAPYNLTGFAPPVEQFVPTITPYLELADGHTIVAGDGADEIIPSADGLSLRAVWKHWAELGKDAGVTIDPGLTTEVAWKIEGDTLVRTEALSSSKPISIKRFWVVVPSTGTTETSSIDNGIRTDRFETSEGTLEVTVPHSDWPLDVALKATGNSALGKGSRGAVPLYMNLESHNINLQPEKPLKWVLKLHPEPLPHDDKALMSSQ